MRTTLKYTLATLNFAILAAFAFSGCESTGRDSASGTHNMNAHKRSYPMSDQNMPGRR